MHRQTCSHAEKNTQCGGPHSSHIAAATPASVAAAWHSSVVSPRSPVAIVVPDGSVSKSGYAASLSVMAPDQAHIPSRTRANEQTFAGVYTQLGVA